MATSPGNVAKAEHWRRRSSGIRLNVGLAYYRQNNFRAAIAPFESVVRDAPDSYQARYLLGLCYFFTERYADAASHARAALAAGFEPAELSVRFGHRRRQWSRPDLEQRASAAWRNRPGFSELHLLLGKAHINRQEYDEAIKELDLAAKANPKLRLSTSIWGSRTTGSKTWAGAGGIPQGRGHRA